MYQIMVASSFFLCYSRNLDHVIGNLAKNFAEGTEYFKVLFIFCCPFLPIGMIGMFYWKDFFMHCMIREVRSSLQR